MTPLEPMQHATVVIDGANGVVYRRDVTGSLGLHLLLPSEAAGGVFARMAEAVGGLVPDVDKARSEFRVPSSELKDTESSKFQVPGSKSEAVVPLTWNMEHGTWNSPAVRGRGIGWVAFNTARIEAGTPLYHIDFGPDSLPGETGLLEDAVSFTKGCYLGQEIVARMKHLGHPKKIIVGLKCEDDRLPIAGSQIHEADAPGGTIIGGITSSTLPPLLGGSAIALASMKWAKHHVGTIVSTPAEGAFVKATVCALPFVKV